MNNKRNKIFIIIEYLVLLPGLLLFVSYIRTQAQSNLSIAVPIDSSSDSQTKNGILKVGSSTLISFGSGVGGGLILFGDSSNHNWASIGIDTSYQNKMSPFWYSINSGTHIPFPLWNISPSSTNSIYTLNQLGFNVNASTTLSSSSMLVFGTNQTSSAVQTSLYVGGSDGFNGVGIVTNAMTTSTVDVYKGDVFDWEWHDINKDAPVMGFFMSSVGSRGIVMTVANPLNLSPEKYNPAIKLNDRWQVPLQVDLNGNAWLGLASTTGAFVFKLQHSNANATCTDIYRSVDDPLEDYQYVKIDISPTSTDFVVPTFSRDVSGAPLYIFPLSKSTVFYKINTTEGCLDDKNKNASYYYKYTQYEPLSKASIFANSVNMINPKDISGWNTMATDTLEALVHDITTNNTYVDPANGVVRGDDAGGTKQTLSLDGIESRGLEAYGVNPANQTGKAVYPYGSFIADSWALCPNGYFITALEWSRHVSSDGYYNGFVPAIKCGRVVDWRQQK